MSKRDQEPIENEAVPDEEYIEEEDSDFNPEEGGSDRDFSDDEEEANSKLKERQKKKQNDEDFDLQTEKEVKNANYSKIESSEGGLIKTRTQRALEEQQGKQFTVVSGEQQGTVNVSDAWEQLQLMSKERLKYKYSSSSPSADTTPQPMNSNEKIKVKRRYEYAGEIVEEEKWVDRESYEAKQYLRSLKEDEKVESSNDVVSDPAQNQKQRLNERGEKLRIIRKRPPLLEGIINGSIKPKFNTLEKSKVDFAKFVDKEGINDELDQHNKGGYLDRQDFLSRVQFHHDSQIKDMRRKELQNKNQ